MFSNSCSYPTAKRSASDTYVRPLLAQTFIGAHPWWRVTLVDVAEVARAAVSWQPTFIDGAQP